ncbi:hypothetical protein AN639_10140 [Candidatus Epulonipiscium fishelsonii]|nr:hypothetical protein AN639_10140 [Epulopiscium sp. SCG-B05WGA-EpuloA1]
MATKYRRINPLNDFVFKKIFGEKGKERELKAFLNAILKNTLPKPIKKVTIVENKELTKELLDDKTGIIDVRATLEDKIIVNIEIQLSDQKNMEKRTLFYWGKLYVGAIKNGQNYKNLPEVITINILDFNLLGTKNYHSTFHLWEDTEKDYKLTDVLEIHFIEYPKFKSLIGNNYNTNAKARWLTLLEKDVDEKIIKELVKMEPAMAYVEETINYISSDPEMIELYEAREKARLDNINMISSAFEEGEKIGEERGEINMIKNFLDILDNETLAIKSGLSLEQVEEIRNQYEN